MKILLVEDNEDIRDATLMELGGHGVICAEDGIEALVSMKAEDFEFDLAIIDFRIPYLDGVAVADILLEHNPDIPVFIVSSGMVDTVHPYLRKQDNMEHVRAILSILDN